MNKYNLIGGLTALVLAGCIAEPKILPRADIQYKEDRNGYFTENEQRYFGENGKRFLVQTDDKGTERKYEMKFDGKEYYPFARIYPGILLPNW